MERYAALAGSFLRRQYLLHLLVTAVLCFLSGCFMSFRNLDASQCGKVMEQYVSFVGILLLTPLFLPEQDLEIWQLEKSKEMDLWKLYLLRLAIGLMGILLIVSLFTGLLHAQGSVFPAWDLWQGSVAETVFLGSIGFFVSACTNQAVLGYMVALIYYMANFGAGKYLGEFALFQMMREEYDFWPYMLAGSLCLVTAGIILREQR